MTRHRLAIAVLCAAVTACGSPAVDDAAGANNGDDLVPPTVDATTDATTDAATATPAAQPECAADLRTLEVATEAYYAQIGAFPTTEADLVEAGMIRREFDAYDLIADGEIVRVSGVACDETDDQTDDQAADDESGEPASADELYASFTDDDIATFGGSECAREIAVVAAAGEEFIAREGRDPKSLDELAADLSAPITLWEYRGVDDIIVPAPGSPCSDFMADMSDDICTAEYRTLQVATEAYAAQHGEPPADIDVLVGDFLRSAPQYVELVDGEVVAVPGGKCEAIIAETLATQCAATHSALEVAVEAFIAQYGEPPFDQQELVDAGMIRQPSSDFEVDGATITTVAGSLCQQ